MSAFAQDPYGPHPGSDPNSRIIDIPGCAVNMPWCTNAAQLPSITWRVPSQRFSPGSQGFPSFCDYGPPTQMMGGPPPMANIPLSTSVNASRPLVLATLSHPPTLDNSSIATSHSMTSPPTTEWIVVPPSPTDDTGQAYRETSAPLQGTIRIIELVQISVDFSPSPVPGLKSLVGLVLNIVEIVNVSFDAACSSHVKC